MAEQDADAQDSDSPTEFGNRLAESLNETFWLPEIERRGGPAAVGPLSKALAVFEPGKPLVTLLNDEVQLVGRAMARRPIEAGEAVTTDDIGEFTEVFPLNVAPDAGWPAWLCFRTGVRLCRLTFAAIVARLSNASTEPGSSWSRRGDRSRTSIRGQPSHQPTPPPNWPSPPSRSLWKQNGQRPGEAGTATRRSRVGLLTGRGWETHPLSSVTSLDVSDNFARAPCTQRARSTPIPRSARPSSLAWS